ncbi:MAG: ferrous iron transport protein A [Sphingomonadales bacterium]|nr:ferrous iron transport protein A [Sphingomonadales bacterium]MBP7135169.1 ferrous iron transport protein A [Sphingomonadaceae bacterium]MBK6491992.1 ferrous iron transport protein A [Sphingomonadales bacterium]MBK6718595.1 ferrous iron transport protein A [Sphingomonadales bacterium]MBK7283348.1 ferrous iron transport protein A [Sphingomonadales bacterium]
MRLDELPLNKPATIAHIGWESLDAGAARRLRALGFDEGLTIEALHHGGLVSHDPIACRIGRMTVAIRRIHASVIDVSPS